MHTIKRMRNGLVFTLVLVLALTVSCSAFAYGNQSINAYKAGEVVIDGDLAEWNLSSPALMNTVEQVVRDPGQWTDENDLSVEIYLMWDAENLYLAAKVLDDTPFMYREGFPPDMADTLVMFLGLDNNADPARTEYVATDFRVSQIIDDYYYNNGIDRDMIADNMGFETAGEDGDLQVLESGFECIMQEIDGGYIYESKISFANFSNENIAAFAPEAGMTIGADFSMFDLDFPCPGVATVRIQWSGSADADLNPSLWGTVTFCEE